MLAERSRKEEKRRIWIIGTEAEDEVSVRSDEDGISLHWNFGEGFVVGVVAGAIGRTHDCLEDVAVEMEGVAAGVVVVEDDFNDFVFLEDEGVGVDAVDGGIGSGDAG